jgi:hypothetical protein
MDRASYPAHWLAALKAETYCCISTPSIAERCEGIGRRLEWGDLAEAKVVRARRLSAASVRQP